MPSTTAVARSSTTVARKVRASTKASLREARTRARRLDTSTIRTAVAMSTPASAARGIQPTTGARASTTTSSTTECTTAASRDRAPDRTLTAVRAIAAVAGMPPSSGETRLARPWPNSSRSGSWRVETLIASATVADSRLSRAASAATATAGATSTRSSLHVTDGTVRVNSCEGSAPIVATGRWASRATTVAPTTASRATGTRGAQAGSRAGSARATPALRARAARSGAENQSSTAATADTTTCSCWAGGAQRGRHLLQGDQGGDAEGEPLDDRQRDEAHVAPGARQRPSRRGRAPPSAPRRPPRRRRARPRSARARRSSRRSGRRPARGCRRRPPRRPRRRPRSPGRRWRRARTRCRRPGPGGVRRPRP